MKNVSRKIISLAIICVVLFSTLFLKPAEAFPLNFNPISFLERTANIIISRTSDIIYYLVMQKRYIFDDYKDPNIYVTPDIPADFEEIAGSNPITLASSTPQEDVRVNIPIPIQTKPLPEVNKPEPVVVSIPPPPVIVAPEPVVMGDSTSTVNEVVEFENFGTDSQILKYTNIERADMSLSALVPNSRLDLIASARADDLFKNQYFDHASPDGKSASELALKMGYEYLIIGENLALGNFDGDKGIVQAWMDSPGHKANILNEKYTQLGVSVKTGLFDGVYSTIAVQIFAKPLATCPKPDPENKNLIDSSSVTIKKMQTEALAMFNNLNNIKNSPDIDWSYYNQKIAEYNYLAKRVNDSVLNLKQIIDVYNQEVSVYNECIK